MINPRAKKNASAINQGIGSPNAEKAAEKGRVFVSTEAPKPIKATAPSGKGCVMIPTIVARKIASSCQAGFVTPEGTGTNQRMTPVAIDASNGFIAAPCHGGEAGVIDVGADDADEAFTAKLEILRVVDVTLDLDNFGSKGETAESLGRFGREGRGFCEVDLRWERERDLRQGRELKEREHDVRANDAILLIYGVQGSELGFQSSLLYSTVVLKGREVQFWGVIDWR